MKQEHNERMPLGRMISLLRGADCDLILQLSKEYPLETSQAEDIIDEFSHNKTNYRRNYDW